MKQQENMITNLTKYPMPILWYLIFNNTLSYGHILVGDKKALRFDSQSYSSEILSWYPE